MLGRIRTIGAACAALALAGGARAQDEGLADRVLLRDESAIDGEVKAEEYDGLTIAVKGANRTVPWESVAYAKYADGEVLANVIESFASGRFDEARAQADEVLSGGGVRPFVAAQALYFRGLAEKRSGDCEAAKATLGELIEEHPKGRYLRHALSELAACHALEGDHAAALAAVDAVLAKVKAQPAFQAESALVRAQLLEAQKKHDEARALYEEVAASKDALKGGVEEARLGLARTLLATGKGAEAATAFQALTKEATSTLVLAGAWNGLGDVWREEGRRKRDQERILEALYAYLRGVVLYVPAPGEPTGDYERALAGAALAYKDLSEIDQNPERKRQARDRFAERRAVLEREFPQSIWLEQLKSL
jgi:tetratricopeptide (TPR) repeat protein